MQIITADYKVFYYILDLHIWQVSIMHANYFFMNTLLYYF